MELFKKLNWYFISEWKRYLGAIILLIIISILQLLPPKLLGMLVDLIVNKQIHAKKILPWIGVMCMIAIIIYILRYLWRILLFGAAYNLAIQLRTKIYFYLTKKNKEFFLKNRTGDLMARATNDVDKVVFAAGEGVLTLVDSLVMGMSVLIVMSTQISFKLTILSLIPMPIMANIIRKYGKELHYYFYKSQAAFSKLNDQTQESLNSIQMIKSFGLEKQTSKKFSKIVIKTGKKNIDVSKIDAKFNPTIHFTISFSHLLAIIGGGYLVWTNEITIGQLTSFIMYLGLMVWPILALAWMFNIVERGSAAWERIQDIFQNNPIIIKKINTLPETLGNLVIKIKKFHYNQQLTLKNIKIKITPKIRIGICGPNGSGKSTILHLIQNNFKLLKKNSIKFHNIPISKINPNIWRKRISIVHQIPFLFSDTIFNNISLGKNNASDEEIIYVSKLVNIHKEIMNLPNKYHTYIGEKGIMLSSGQKQRIALARSLISNPEILILDDILSSVDIHTENIILNNLNSKEYKNKSIIIISNRLSTLMNTDKIIVIKKGSIFEEGTHEELLKNKKWYYNIYHNKYF